MSDSLTFGGWLLMQRHERGVTQEELAYQAAARPPVRKQVSSYSLRPAASAH